MVAWHTGDPAADQILKNLEAALSGIRDYTVTLDVVARLERMSVPPMQLTMFYKVPDKVHFESKGFALVPREGVPWSPAWLLTRFRAERTDRDTLDGVPVHRVALEPVDDRARARRVTLWVHPHRWTAERVRTATIDGRTIEASFSYERVSDVWLPSLLVLKITPSPLDTAQSADPTPSAPVFRGGFRSGTIEVRYSGYRVNTGLSDSLFTRPDQGVR
jgi:hypothetical protein